MDNGLSYIVPPRFGTHFLEVHVHACMCHHLIGRRSRGSNKKNLLLFLYLDS